MLKNLVVAVTLALSSLSAIASDYQEMYVAFPEETRIVITNAECVKFKKEYIGVYQLNYAYAIKLDTKEVVTGCFTHHGDIIEIELVEDDDPKTTDDESRKFYHYNIKADNFVPVLTPFVVKDTK